LVGHRDSPPVIGDDATLSVELSYVMCYLVGPLHVRDKGFTVPSRLTFTSHRDTKGYRIVGEVPPPRRGHRAVSLQELLDAPSSIMGKLLGDFAPFEIHRVVGEYGMQPFLFPDDGQVPCGRLGRPDDVSGEWLSGHIVGLGGKQEKILLEQYPDAFTNFANLKTKSELLGFFAKFGPLSNGPLICGKHESVFELLWEAEQMRECIRADTSEHFYRNLSLAVSLIKNRKTGELETVTEPRCLLDALWLQFQYSKSSGAEFRTCPRCQEIFPVGGNSGRLRTAEFCSPEHRKRYNSLARSNPKMRKMRGRQK
jgi:hypothetical protein